jgi:hypothetical protein
MDMPDSVSDERSVAILMETNALCNLLGVYCSAGAASGGDKRLWWVAGGFNALSGVFQLAAVGVEANSAQSRVAWHRA